jgi:hypothetical protein
VKTPISLPELLASSTRRTEASRATASGVAEREYRQLRRNLERPLGVEGDLGHERLVGVIGHGDINKKG